LLLEAFFAMENSGELDRRLKQVMEEETPFETILFPNHNNQQSTLAMQQQQTSGSLSTQIPKELSLSSSPTEKYEPEFVSFGNHEHIEEFYDTTTLPFAASASDPSNASEVSFYFHSKL